MVTEMLKNKTFIILTAIILIGLVLRVHNYSTSPRFGATMDEFAWTWLGINLIQEGAPKSWSSHPQYIDSDRNHLIYKGAAFWIVAPYLEHPPFFGVVAGSFALLNGADNMYDIDVGRIRPLAIILGVISIGVLFLLVKEVYDKETALLASLIYAVIPTVAIGSRIVQNENFFIPGFLTALLLTIKYVKTNNKLFIVFVSVLCGLLLVSKIPWIAACVAVISILIYFKKYKESAIVFGTVLAFFLGYIAYGYYYDWNLFVSLWKLQLQRYDLTFNSVYAIFKDPFLADRHLIDGWIYFGWISFFLLLIKDFKKNFLPILGLLAYLGVFIFAIPNEPGHGWYRYPFYPFLAISLAIFIKDYFNKNILLTFIFILFLGLSLLELTFTKMFGFSFIVFRAFLIISSLSLLPLFFQHKIIKKYIPLLNYLFLIGIFSLSFLAVILYKDI